MLFHTGDGLRELLADLFLFHHAGAGIHGDDLLVDQYFFIGVRDGLPAPPGHRNAR